MKDLLTIRRPDLKIIIIGFLGFQSLRFFGSIVSPLELFGTIYFFYQVLFDVKKRINLLFKNNIYQKFTILLFLWSGCQLISDVINQSSIRDSIRGIFSPILLVVTIRFLLLLNEYFKEEYFLEDILIGYSLYRVYGLLFLSNSIENALKMGGIIALGFLVFSLFKSDALKIIISFMFIIISLFYAIRSSVITFSLLLIINLVIKGNKSGNINIKILPNILNGIFKYFFILLALLLLSPLFNSFNSLLININPYGERTVELQSQYKRKGGVFSARPEYLSFFSAFKDSPIIGHGSWATDKDSGKYFLIKERNKIENQKKSDRTILNQKCKDRVDCKTKIPTHSPIQQTVIWAGIFSSAFFFFLLNINLNIIYKLNLDSTKKLLIINNIFNIFFTPLLGNQRGFLPIICFMIIILLTGKKNEQLINTSD